MINVFRDTDVLLNAVADLVVATATQSVAHKGRFDMVLSGGSSPKKLYELLASERYRDKVPWDKVFFFFGDERYVPAQDPQSNFLMAQMALFTPLEISEHQIFAINTILPPPEAAQAYEQQIRQHFAFGECRFDLVLLGLGDNAHTASLFPHTSVLHEKSALIKEVFVEEVKMYRITFTAPLINAASIVAFLVYGQAKAEAVHHILEDPLKVDEFPAQLIHPDPGELLWFLDDAAASQISHRG